MGTSLLISKHKKPALLKQSDSVKRSEQTLRIVSGLEIVSFQNSESRKVDEIIEGEDVARKQQSSKLLALENMKFKGTYKGP
ncbi:hypothetical protein H920_00401 [Fukomys damarensis]|uniref:Uncharacterized protein n=1 Tax=Fukomys damarensis TaxID=885580 RepID=A0A091E610_FUKDA|nr:hypothetical protein H920_00401 [Fukomys damarensis]